MFFPFENIVEIKETHLSRVYITDHYVYKLKKTVQFEFVDYSTTQKRFEAAINEIRLNKRTSQGVYLGLSFLRYDGATHASYCDYSLLVTDDAVLPPPRFDDVVVVMRRLDEAHFLSSLVAADQVVSQTHLSPLVAKFYACMRRHSTKCDPLHYYSYTEHAVLENLNYLHRSDIQPLLPSWAQTLVVHLINTVPSTLAANREQLIKRFKSGLVVDGHGDLRLDHVCFEYSAKPTSPDQIQIFDCVEFNEDLRRNDIISELAFLSMCFDFVGRGDLAQQTEHCYRAIAQEDECSQLFTFFKSYRALVRAKVEIIRALQLGDRGNKEREIITALRYLSFAGRYALGLEGPLLILVCGLMGTGKSTVAMDLSHLFAADVYNSDVVRKELFKIPMHTNPKDDLAYGKGIYSADSTQHTYNELFNLARRQLAHGNPVIIDATFLKAELRRRARNTARDYGAQCVILECTLPRTLLLQRLEHRYKQRQSVSDARPELLAEQESNWEKIDTNEADQVLRVSTEQFDFTKLIELALKLCS